MTIKAYNMKVIVSGGVYEFYRYEDTMFRGYEQKRGAGSSNTFYDSEGIAMRIDPETGEMIPKALESRGRSNIRARNELRRLALSNFSNKSRFLTLTFKENMADLTEANKLFKAFVRKIKKERPDFKYIAVIEFQKRGTIHYHLLCNLNYMNFNVIRDHWRGIVGEGNVDVQRIDHVDNIGAYIIKYMTKEDADPRLVGKKMYQTSQKLVRPIELVGAKAEWLYEQMQKEGIKKAYSSSYENKQTTNQIHYEEYNLRRSQASVKDVNQILN